MSRTYTREEFKEILNKHSKWHRGETDGSRADLRSADLGGANLYGANLYGADLYGANLYGADLRSADLRSADLRSADLRSADLRSADLGGADLGGANLYGADLRSANLRSADLGGANLYGANLYGADLYGANLYGADLGGANLYGANLYGADLYGAKDLDKAIGLTRNVLPEEGEFIAYKKVQSAGGKRVLVLLVPEYAGRVTPYSDRKSRVSHATPLRAETLDGKAAPEIAFWSMHDDLFKYEIGKESSVADWDDSKLNVCTRGIHLYISRKEAQEHQ